jgi:DNA invertase Pin-like site-specific DNA recombinase
MRAFLYARVSTADKEQDPRPQLAEMRSLSKTRAWVPFEFSEYVSSGKRRPEFERMMELARRGGCDVIVCRHFDRIARSTRELLELLDELKSRNIDFVSVNQQIDTTTPAGRLMFTMIAAFAEFEKSMLRERVLLGMAAARAKGKKFGRPRRIADRLKIRTLRAQGEPWGEVAQQAGVSVSTAKRLAKYQETRKTGQKAVQKPVKNAHDKKRTKKPKSEGL